MIQQLHEFRSIFKKVILESFCNFEHIAYDDETINTALISNSIAGFADFKAIEVVENTLRALDFICQQNLHTTVIDKDFFCLLNEKITYLALDQNVYGEYRKVPVRIPTVGVIDVPDPKEVNKLVESFNQIEKPDYKHIVAHNMLQLMKLQPFENGNKRTALFLTNCGLIKNDLGIVYFTREQYNLFRNLLSDYYNGFNSDVVEYVQKNCFHDFQNRIV